ncbi:hypothetical protein CIG19_20150 [Enterobacterales bacterium CwR94]|nr:hypothetical protein CIG19_20150 [Enterobacterales bacterium CwR94]
MARCHYTTTPMKIKHTSLLLPVLLGGCNIPHSRTGLSDPGQFVEAQIAIQLQSIQRSQNELKRAADGYGSEQKKPKPMTSKSATTLTPDKLRNLSHVKSLGVEQSFSYINISERNIKPRLLLQKIVPPGWKIAVSADMNAKFDRSVSLNSSDQWPYALDRLLQQNGWVGLIDWSNKQVSVAYQASAFSTSPPAASSSLPDPERLKTTTTSSGLKNNTPSRNPFSNSRGTTDKITSTSPAGKIPVNEPMNPKVAPVLKPLPVPKIWRIDAGNTLKDALFNWAATEKCTTPGVNNWTVAWLTSVNYRVDAPLQFEGNFREVLNKLFTLYGRAQVPLYAGVRSAQCVVSVDDKGIH